MIGALIRRDSSLRYLGRWLFVGPMLMLTMMGVIVGARVSSGADGTTALDHFLTLLALWLPAAVYAGVNAWERRCSRFDMELPIPSRDLWASRLVSMSIAGLAVLAFTAGLMGFVSWAINAWIGVLPKAFARDVLVLALRVAAVVLLGVTTGQCTLPALERLPSGRRLAWSIIGVLVAFFILVLALGALPLAVSLVPAALALLLARRTYRALSPNMVLSPREHVWLAGSPRGAARASAAVSPDRWSSEARARGPVGRLLALVAMVTRSTTKFPVAPVIGVPILLAAGFTMAGAFGNAIRGDDSIRFSLLFIIAYTLMSFSGLPPRKLFMVDAWPISRRFVFAAIYLPLVVVLGVGYGAGRIVADRAEGGSELIKFIERDDHLYVSAPLRHGAIAWDGNPPEAVAPWGESHEVWWTPIWAGKTPVVHSLYSTPPGSSAEFVAWQITRAVRDLYGADITSEEVLVRYLTTDGLGRIVPAGGGLTLAADHPEWRVRPHGPVFPVMMLVVCGLWLIAMSFYLATLRAGYTERRKKGAFWWGMIALMGLHVSQFAALITENLDHWVLSGTSMIVVRSAAERSPGGSAAVWALCGLALFGFYRIAESRFLKVESSPGDDMRIALIERPIGASGQEGAYAR